MRLWLALSFALLLRVRRRRLHLPERTERAPPAAVSPLPNPSLPPWIAKISPTGVADENAQVRIRFKDDVIPLESLASTDRAAALAAFSIDPAIPGRFVLLYPAAGRLRGGCRAAARDPFSCDRARRPRRPQGRQTRHRSRLDLYDDPRRRKRAAGADQRRRCPHRLVAAAHLRSARTSRSTPRR